jgi:S-adenosylmethionine synthetase
LAYESDNLVWWLMGLSVKGIIEKFDLRCPIYKNTAKYGHFGKVEYSWEKIVDSKY